MQWGEVPQVDYIFFSLFEQHVPKDSVLLNKSETECWKFLSTMPRESCCAEAYNEIKLFGNA